MDQLSLQKLTKKRQKRIDRLQRLYARGKKLTTQQYVERLCEIRDSYVILMCIKAAQQTVSGTGACTNIIEKMHWLIDSISPTKRINDNKRLERVGIDFIFDGIDDRKTKTKVVNA